jgi:hypothetical protein
MKRTKSKKKYNRQTEKRKTTDIQMKTSFSFLFERNKNHEFGFTQQLNTQTQ